VRILTCTFEYPPTLSWGTGNAVWNLVTQLRELGVSCTVCSPIDGDIKLCSRHLVTSLHRSPPLYYLYAVLYFWHKASRYVQRHRSDYDAVWLHNPSPLSFRASVPHGVATMHVTYLGTSRVHQPLVRHLHQVAMVNCERHVYSRTVPLFTGVTRQICSELNEIGIPPSRTVHIPNGVDTARFKPRECKRSVREKAGLPPDARILLSVARFSPEKQPLHLIETFAHMDGAGRDLALVLAGDGPLLGRARQMVAQSGLKNVLLPGHVDHETELPELYSCADYYILASSYEGEPLALLEAMAAGLPCIVSDIPGPSELVREAGCGVVVDFRRPHTAARAIDAYLAQDNGQHSANGRAYVVGKRSWRAVARQYLEQLVTVKSQESGVEGPRARSLSLLSLLGS
jgi:glycosyltransferase involved in cell wall biosynthesis